MLLRLWSTSLGVAARRAAAEVRDAQVAGVDEADELGRLVVQQRVRPDRVAGASPGVGKPRPDVGPLQVVRFGRRRRGSRRSRAGPSPACRADRAAPDGMRCSRRSWPSATSAVCCERSSPRSSSGTGYASGPPSGFAAGLRAAAARARAARRLGAGSRQTGPRDPAVVTARRAEEGHQQDDDCQRQSMRRSQPWR